jgi:hypothetical protein
MLAKTKKATGIGADDGQQPLLAVVPNLRAFCASSRRTPFPNVYFSLRAFRLALSPPSRGPVVRGPVVAFRLALAALRLPLATQLLDIIHPFAHADNALALLQFFQRTLHRGRVGFLSPELSDCGSNNLLVPAVSTDTAATIGSEMPFSDNAAKGRRDRTNGRGAGVHLDAQ